MHLTTDDLARVSLSPTTNPMWDIALSLHVLDAGHTGPSRSTARSITPRARWRRGALRRLRAAGFLDETRALIELCPAASYFPDFLTPDAASLDDGLTALASTPASIVDRDLALLDGVAPVTSFAAGLRSGAGALRRLAAMLGTYNRLVLSPYLRGMGRVLDAERSMRTRRIVDAGTAGLLHSFDPGVLRLTGLTLEVGCPDADVDLGGRGLRLMPSWFCEARPVVARDLGPSPVLVHPVARQLEDGDVADGDLDRAAAIAPLLGRTRAQVLDGLRHRPTTGELARHLDVAASSVSEHVSVLRAAGLVVSRRCGGQVIHTVTPLGHDLLRVSG